MVVTNWQGMDNARREVIIARDSECLETADIVPPDSPETSGDDCSVIARNAN